MPETTLTLRSALLAGAAALVLGGALLFGLAPDSSDVSAAGSEPVLRRVALYDVAPRSVRARAEVAGMLEPARSVELFAETRGPVLEVGAEELDRVALDQVLLRIDPLQAEAALERASATVARSGSELALARSNLARRESLTERGVASSADLEDAQNAEKVALASLRQARAELTRVRDDLAKKVIAAPFAGVLRSFDVEAGEYVHEGQRLGELLDLSSARAVLGLSDREVVAVEAGAQVDGVVEAWPGERFQGRILRVGAATDPVTRKFPIEVEFPSPDGRLLPGMIVTVAFELGSPVERTVIPRDATLDEFGQRYVWVAEPVDGELEVRRRHVVLRPIPFRPGDVEVISGLENGERIALSGVRQLQEGERIRVASALP